MVVDLNLLRDTAKELLESRGVYDIGVYGWLNENEIDSDFVGYVMWVQDPPYHHDFMAWQDDVPPRRAPTPQKQRLMEIGSDFLGLMKTARHFIGHALLYQPLVNPLRIEPTEFDFSEFAALGSLTAAHDRLRDFIITAVLGQKTKAEGELDASYVLIEKAGLTAEVVELRSGMRAAREARAARNVAIHELATQSAQIQRYMIDADRSAFIAQSWPKSKFAGEDGLAAMIEDGRGTDAKSLANIEERMQLLCGTYIGFVKTGEVTFRTEHAFRHRNGDAAR